MATFKLTGIIGITTSGAISGLNRLSESFRRVTQSANSTKVGFDNLARAFVAVSAARNAVRAMSNLAKSAAELELQSAKTLRVLGKQNSSVKELTGIFQNLSTTIPKSSLELAEVGEQIARMGVALKDLPELVKVSSIISEIAGLDATQVAEQLATLAIVTGTSTKQFSNLASAILQTADAAIKGEADVLQLSARFAAAATNAGFSREAIIALAGALGDAGISAELGGTAMQKFVLTLGQAVKEGSIDLEILAEIAGTTAKQFQKFFEKDAGRALVSLLRGLKRIKDANQSLKPILKLIGVENQRQIQSIQGLIKNIDKLEESITNNEIAFRENTKILSSHNLIVGQTANQLKLLRNNFKNLTDVVGTQFLGVLGSLNKIFSPILQGLKALITEFGALPPLIRAITISLLLLIPVLLLLISTTVKLLTLFASAFGLAIGGVIGSLVGLGIGIAATAIGINRLIKNFRNVKSSTNEANQKFSQVGKTLHIVSQNSKDFATQIAASEIILKRFKTLFDDLSGILGLKNILSIISNILEKITSKFIKLINKFNEVKNIIADFLGIPELIQQLKDLEKAADIQITGPKFVASKDLPKFLRIVKNLARIIGAVPPLPSELSKIPFRKKPQLHIPFQPEVPKNLPQTLLPRQLSAAVELNISKLGGEAQIQLKSLNKQAQLLGENFDLPNKKVQLFKSTLDKIQDIIAKFNPQELSDKSKKTINDLIVGLKSAQIKTVLKDYNTQLKSIDFEATFNPALTQTDILNKQLSVTQNTLQKLIETTGSFSKESRKIGAALLTKTQLALLSQLDDVFRNSSVSASNLGLSSEILQDKLSNLQSLLLPFIHIFGQNSKQVQELQLSIANTSKELREFNSITAQSPQDLEKIRGQIDPLAQTFDEFNLGLKDLGTKADNILVLRKDFNLLFSSIPTFTDNFNKLIKQFQNGSISAGQFVAQIQKLKDKFDRVDQIINKTSKSINKQREALIEIRNILEQFTTFDELLQTILNNIEDAANGVIKFSDIFQGIDLHGLQLAAEQGIGAITDGLIDAAIAGDSLVDVLKSIARTILTDLAKSFARLGFRLLFQAIGSAVGGGIGGGGGMFGTVGTGSNFFTASGGVFTSPQTRIIAERGPEAVIPLQSGAIPVSFMSMPDMQSGNTQPIELTIVNAPDKTSGQKLAAQRKAILNIITQDLEAGGTTHKTIRKTITHR